MRWSSAGRPARFLLANTPLELGEFPVLQLRRAGVVAAALRQLHVQAHALQLFLELARVLDRVLLLLPVRLQRVVFLLEIGELLLEAVEALARRLVGFLPQRLALDLELHHAAAYFVELRRHRIDLHAQLRGRFVDEVDRLVGRKRS
jgi:hypothetical protein